MEPAVLRSVRTDAVVAAAPPTIKGAAMHPESITTPTVKLRAREAFLNEIRCMCIINRKKR